VGGLELASESKSTSQVPVLGDIPLVGELFKNRSKGASKNKFFAFIRASVLRSESFDDLRFRSLKDASDAGLPQDWPKVEPRVLEVDP
jgi:type II secretory pathway component GspD/PulD (secretin)